MSKTNIGLIEYARGQIGKPYWWGTYGQVSSKTLYEAKKRQYPASYQATDFLNQLGVKVHDCSGLIKGYLMSDSVSDSARYVGNYDKSADGMLSIAKEKGPISTLPELPGILVHKKGHIGIYIGNGEVIEARSHARGVIKSRLRDIAWTNWSKCPWIEYTFKQEGAKVLKAVEEVQAYLNKELKINLAIDNNYGQLTRRGLVMLFQKVVGGLDIDGSFGSKSQAKAKANNLQRGNKGQLVLVLQFALICKGYSIGSYGADASFGPSVEAAVIAFQKDNGLVADGIVGSKSWSKLLS